MDDEDTLLHLMGPTSHPPNIDINDVFSKAARLSSWHKDASQCTRDLEATQAKLAAAKASYRQFEDQRGAWFDTFDASRKLFTSLLGTVNRQNRELKAEGERLFALCVAECAQTKEDGGSAAPGALEMSTGLTIKDIVEELERRETSVYNQKQQLSKLPLKSSVVEVKIDDASVKNTSTTGMVVKSEASQSAQNPEDHDAATDAIQRDARNLQIIMQNLRDTVERNELLEGDVEVFFQEREDNLTFIEQVLVQKATGIPLDKRPYPVDEAVDKTLAAQTFAALCQQTPRQWDAFLVDVLDSLDSNHHSSSSLGDGLLTTRNKKRRSTPDSVALSVNVRSRTERGELLTYTPLSQFEDRYIGRLPISTIFAPHRTGRRPDQTINIRDQFIPPQVARAEDECMIRCDLQSEAAGVQLQIKQLQNQLVELQRLQTEADLSLHKAQLSHRQVVQEDQLEYNRTMALLAEHGLLSSTVSHHISTNSLNNDEDDVHPPSLSAVTLPPSSIAAPAAKPAARNGRGGAAAARKAAAAAAAGNAVSRQPSVTSTTTSSSVAASETTSPAAAASSVTVAPAASNGRGGKTSSRNTSGNNSVAAAASAAPVAPTTTASTTNNKAAANDPSTTLKLSIGAAGNKRKSEAAATSVAVEVAAPPAKRRR